MFRIWDREPGTLRAGIALAPSSDWTLACEVTTLISYCQSKETLFSHEWDKDWIYPPLKIPVANEGFPINNISKCNNPGADDCILGGG